MFGYVVRRLVASALVLVLTSFTTFTLFFEGPTGQFEDLCHAHGRCTPEKLQAIEASTGFDDGLLVNYGRFVGGLFHDRTIMEGSQYHCAAPCLGVSFHTHDEVTQDLLQYYPPTLALALGGGLLYVAIGLPLAALAARFRGSLLDKLLMSLSLTIGSIPFYVLALAAWIYLTVAHAVFPSMGYTPLTQSPARWFAGLLLPWLVLGITGATTYVRYGRGEMVLALSEDYVLAGRSRGVSERTLMFRHAARVALVPLVTIFGLDLADLLGGTVFLESVFHVPGVGDWTLTSIRAPIDLPVVNATVLLYAVLVVVGNLVVDLFYAILDPRVRLV